MRYGCACSTLGVLLPVAWLPRLLCDMQQTVSAGSYVLSLQASHSSCAGTQMLTHILVCVGLEIKVCMWVRAWPPWHVQHCLFGCPAGIVPCHRMQCPELHGRHFFLSKQMVGRVVVAPRLAVSCCTLCRRKNGQTAIC